MIPELARALMCTQLLCVCVCGKMYHGRTSICAFEMESKGLSKCHVELCQCELQMRLGQVGRDQDSCDVGGSMCVRACVRVYLCVFVCEDVSRVLFDVYF